MGRPVTRRLWEHSGNMWVKHIQVSFIIRKYHGCGEDGTMTGETLVRVGLIRYWKTYRTLRWRMQRFCFNCLLFFPSLTLTVSQTSTHTPHTIMHTSSLDSHWNIPHTHTQNNQLFFSINNLIISLIQTKSSFFLRGGKYLINSQKQDALAAPLSDLSAMCLHGAAGFLQVSLGAGCWLART